MRRLVELDPRDFQIAADTQSADMDRAEASAADIDARLQEQKTVIAQNEAAVAGDRVTLEFVRQHLERHSGPE